MKIIGRIEGNELVITLSPHRWRAVLDTGFTSEILLTEELANQIGLVAVTTDWVKLADGTRREFAFDLSVIDWFGQDRVTEFCWLPGSQGKEVLIGIGLLKSPPTKLIVNFAASSVIIQRL